MKLKLTIAYFGQRYHGWQRQADGLPTVQGCLEAAAVRVFKQPLQIVGASRTDAGVHAEGQSAHIVVENPIPIAKVAPAVNSRLPTDIELRAVEPADDDFHARRDARWKWYRYRVHNATGRPTADWGRVWHYWRKLDLSRMQAAAERLVGTHDFAALESTTDQPRESTVRTILQLDLMRHYDQLLIDVAGDGFLYRMVRNIVGLLTEVGRGKRPPDWVDELLTGGKASRRQGGMPAAPPQGLTLMKVHYAPHPRQSPQVP